MKILQLLQVSNWWIKYVVYYAQFVNKIDNSLSSKSNSISSSDSHEAKYIKKPCYFYTRVAFFALCEDDGYQDIIPIDFDESGMWDLQSGNREGWIYSEIEPKDDDIPEGLEEWNEKKHGIRLKRFDEVKI